MAYHKRLDVLIAMKQIGLIPVFYHGDFQTVKNIAISCAEGGGANAVSSNRVS
jgi:hypothetical protein